ncbi:hypothetical protein DPEC_G00156480 [Dallia pectoralis]|uniref:Uncharacterized protein n=1 Tax=Dallia pectoralis TaxID=75939 RepID=A0ACC2GKD2_DALPE|nr:hypothetical protein DPEC_G00156480 [Dallia pectoralis]
MAHRAQQKQRPCRDAEGGPHQERQVSTPLASTPAWDKMKTLGSWTEVSEKKAGHPSRTLRVRPCKNRKPEGVRVRELEKD